MTIRSKLQGFLTSFLLLVASICFCLIIGEFILRIILDPGDFLRPSIIQDDILEMKVQANSAGHDAWGYRNPSVPPSVDIVTIGDSQTYGAGVTPNNSWPSKLQKLLYKDIYNISLGGFNPVQYYYLLKEKAIQLNPSMIIIGFYFGNDIIGAYRTVYTKEYWKYLRNPDFAINHNTDLNLNDLSPKPYKYFRGIRAWLSKHSILYRASVFSFGNAYRFFEMKYGPSTDNITIFEDKTLNVRTGFTPKRRLIALNFQDPKVREGLRLSLELLSKMRDICKNESIDFFVVLIPTKEHVYSEYIENNTKLKNSDIINALLKNERDANIILKDYLKKNNIEYFDVLEPLKKSLVKKTIYPLSSDGHPNGEGHAIIANAVKQYIVERKLLGN